MTFAAWATIAAMLATMLRKAGPWWKVAIGCAAWPAWPALAAWSYASHRARRARHAID